MHKSALTYLLVVFFLLVVTACVPAPPLAPAPTQAVARAAQPTTSAQPAAVPATPNTAESAAAAGSLKNGDWASPAPSKLPLTVTIGSVLGVTGDVAVYGEVQKKGIELAVQQINASGYLGQSKLTAVIEDSTGTNEGAIAAMTKVIDAEKAVGVIGPTLSAQAFAADPIAQAKSIPVIGPSNTLVGIVEMGNFIFRDSLPESSVIPGTIKAVVDLLDVKNVGILWGNDDFSAGGYKVFKQALQDNRIEILDEETFARGDVDFNAQLTKIIAKKPDALVVSALATEAGKIITQARSLGFAGPIVGGNGLNSPTVIQAAGQGAEGVIVGAAWNIASQAPLSAAFVKAYQTAYNAPPDQFAAQAYTAAWLMATAIRQADSVDPKAIRDALAAIKNLDTPLGKFSFSEDRNPNHPPVVQIVRNGHFVLLTPETAKN